MSIIIIISIIYRIPIDSRQCTEQKWMLLFELDMSYSM